MNNELLDKYSKKYGVRFHRHQKERFIKELQKDMSEAQYEMSEINKRSYLVFQSKNYFFGDIERAKYVIMVPYDTPERKFWRNVCYYPFDGVKNMNKNMKSTYIPIIIFYVIILIILYGVTGFVDSPSVRNIISSLMMIAMVALVYMMMKGFANRNNVNRNSASIVAAIELAKSLDKSQKVKVAFVFSDKNKSSYQGCKAIMEEFAKLNRNPQIIYLDSMGYGKTSAIGYMDGNRKLAADLASFFKLNQEKLTLVKVDSQKAYQNAFLYMKKAVMISSGDIDEEKSLYVLNSATSKDKVVDSNRIDALMMMIEKYLKDQL